MFLQTGAKSPELIQTACRSLISQASAARYPQHPPEQHPRAVSPRSREEGLMLGGEKTRCDSVDPHLAHVGAALLLYCAIDISI
jgi:hypothetical protein